MAGGAATVLVCSATTNAEKKHILKLLSFKSYHRLWFQKKVTS